MLTGLLMILVSCSQEKPLNSSEKSAIDTTALRVAVMPTIDCLPLFVADHEGMFKKANIKVQLLHFQAQMDCDTALVRGWAEGVVSDLVRTEHIKQQGTPLHYTTSTILHWQLITNKMARIKLLSQLEDKMIAMTRYSATAMLADHAVDSVQLASDHVFRIQVNDIGVRLSMMESNIIDALFIPEPQATQTRLTGCPVLMDTRDMDWQMGVIAFHEKAYQYRRQQIDDFMEVYNAACDTINSQGIKHYRSLIEKCCGVKPVTIDSLPSTIHFSHAESPRQVDVARVQKWLNNN